MCAGTVAAPVAPVSAATPSITSRSRSVAFRLSLDLSARISTLARIGMVLRRSTTRWTRPSDFNNAVRSTVTFISQPVRRKKSAPIRGGREKRSNPYRAGAARVTSTGRIGKGGGSSLRPFSSDSMSQSCSRPASVLQLALQDLDLLGQAGVVADEILDLAHRMQHRRMVAPAETPADLRQGA